MLLDYIQVIKLKKMKSCPINVIKMIKKYILK